MRFLAFDVTGGQWRLAPGRRAFDSGSGRGAGWWRSTASVGLVIALGLFGLSGCGEKITRVPVSGQVLLDGKPLTLGKIVIAPQNDRPASGELGPDGRFELTTVKPGDGCVIGTHRVAVTAVDRTNLNQVRCLVPEKYGDFYTSELTVDIRGPTKDVVIQLHDDDNAATRILVEQGDWAPGQK